MLKIGVIGLGDIAQKAYLPVLGQQKVDVHLCTRDETKLRHVSEQYRFANQHRSLDTLIRSGIKAAFVHTATASHYAIVEELLANTIHVYVDKPITYDYATAEKLMKLANQKKVMLRVGFNRRFAPAYQDLKRISNPNMFIMQKNRKFLPGEVRKFIFDDFIHVVDTLLHLFPYSIDTLIVNGRKKDNILYHVVVQFIAKEGQTAIGIMNRDSGTVLEKLEVFSADETRVVYDLMESNIFRDKTEMKLGMNDWESTLYKRGFEQIVDNFLKAVESGAFQQDDRDDALLTHKICEQIVEKIGE